MNTLQPNQLQWLRQHLVKDGIHVFREFEQTPVIRLDDQTRKMVAESRK